LIGAVDIGGTKIAVGIIDESGRVLARRECTTSDLGYAHALSNIEEMLHTTARMAKTQISGIGIGSHGPVYPLTGEVGEIVDAPLLAGWKGHNPVEDLARLFGVKVAIENDADASALGEAGWGAGKNKKKLIYVTVGTGIGVGFIVDGNIYRGVDYSHPEIGHHVIDASGPLCTCGFRGCWESLAAGPAIVEWLKAAAPPEYPHRDALTAKRIFELAVGGDDWARRAMDREIHYLGLGLANLVTLFVPDAIVLGGSIMKRADLLLEGIRKIIRESCRFVPSDRTELTLASLGEDANLIGAGRVWHHRFAAQ
jgi:glucokinase